MARPQLSKEAIKEAMKGAKRVNKITPNMILNQTILDHYHNVRPDDQDQESPLIVLHQELLGGGAWTRKAKRKMREKYFIAREHAPRATPGEDRFPPDGIGLTSYPLQGLRDVVKLGLKSYESLLAMSMVTKEWTPSNTHSADRHLMPEYRPFQTADIKLDGKDDKNKITIEIQKVQKVVQHLDTEP